MRPFSSRNYSRNARTCKLGETPCAVCGLPCREPWANTVHVKDGRFVPEGARHPVGSECVRVLLAAGVEVN